MHIGSWSLSPTLLAYLISLVLLLYWCRRLEVRRFALFVHFFISTSVGPLFTAATEEKTVEVWFPFGFLFVIAYLQTRHRDEPNRWRAAFLGVFVGIIEAVEKHTHLL